MALIEELAKARTKTESRHKLGRVLDNLDAPEMEALQEALADPELSAEAISRALRATGTKIGSSSVRRYRRDVLGMTFDD